MVTNVPCTLERLLVVRSANCLFPLLRCILIRLSHSSLPTAVMLSREIVPQRLQPTTTSARWPNEDCWLRAIPPPPRERPVLQERLLPPPQERPVRSSRMRPALRTQLALPVSQLNLSQKTTCSHRTISLAPEVTEGPYYLNNDLIRQDLREDRQGVLLELDIGVIDTSTCQPLPSALGEILKVLFGRTVRSLTIIPVELWHCDAVGTYSCVDFPHSLRRISSFRFRFPSPLSFLWD
jgi:hypothetical protein